LVAVNIPTVAKVTQGEVISFAASAISTLASAGQCVLLEGRSQTVDYVRTQHRFMLTLSDGSLIGKRRAAQRVGAEALGLCKEVGIKRGGREGVDRVLVKCAENLNFE